MWADLKCIAVITLKTDRDSERWSTFSFEGRVIWRKHISDSAHSPHHNAFQTLQPIRTDLSISTELMDLMWLARRMSLLPSCSCLLPPRKVSQPTHRVYILHPPCVLAYSTRKLKKFHHIKWICFVKSRLLLVNLLRPTFFWSLHSTCIE